MKNSNCGNCPHIHRCYATNDDECIDTIIGKKHYMSEHDKQIRADAINEFANALINDGKVSAMRVLKIKEQLKENKNDLR